jgi:hypothetical protein
MLPQFGFFGRQKGPGARDVQEKVFNTFQFMCPTSWHCQVIIQSRITWVLFKKDK